MPGYQQRLKRCLETSPDTSEGQASSELPSCLANHLLILWGRGDISATALQKLAHAAILDGSAHKELLQLAGLGSFGQHAANITRDLKVFLEKTCKNKYPMPIQLTTEMVDPKTSQIENAQISIFRPDDLVSGIYTDASRFEMLFRTNACGKFWSSIRTDDPKLQILLQEMKWKRSDLNMVVPMYLHGDGVQFENNDSMMVYHMGSLLNPESSLDSGLLLAACPKSCATEKTWKVVWDNLCDGFKVCQDGCNADDCEIAGGWKFVIWQLLGDQDHFSNQYKMPHWRNQCYCWECKADQKSDVSSGFDFDKVHLIPKRSVADELATRLSDHPVFSIRGVSHFNIAQDMLHICFVHGVVNKAMGSALKDWCWKDGKGRQKAPPVTRLAWIFQRIQTLYSEKRVACRLSNIKIKMFVSQESPHQSFPELRCKGAECKHLTEIFSILAAELHDGSEKSELRRQLFQNMFNFQTLADIAPMVPSDDQAAQAQGHMVSFLKQYHALSQMAKADDEMNWHIVSKHHRAFHLSENFKFLNCKFNWCFKSEDFVGRIAILGHSVTFGVRSTAITLKLMEKYRLLMYLKFSRDNIEA